MAIKSIYGQRFYVYQLPNGRIGIVKFKNDIPSVASNIEEVWGYDIYDAYERGRDLFMMRGNPAFSERQRRFMCAELGRKRAGKKTKIKMTEQQLREFCRKDNLMTRTGLYYPKKGSLEAYEWAEKMKELRRKKKG